MNIQTTIAITVEEGLDFVSSHFQEPVWPRNISTRTTGGSQILVYSSIHQPLTAFFRVQIE